jgi:ABC-type glucose/galactose transport system permease subunit
MTTVAVVAAWVWFRADDAPAAINILRGMAGLNGISVHDASSRVWSFIASLVPRMSIVSQGGFQHLYSVGFAKLAILFSIAAILVWTMPNTAQIARRVEQLSQQDAAHPLFARLVPAAFGLLLAMGIVMMQKASAFLYFRF